MPITHPRRPKMSLDIVRCPLWDKTVPPSLKTTDLGGSRTITNEGPGNWVLRNRGGRKRVSGERSSQRRRSQRGLVGGGLEVSVGFSNTGSWGSDKTSRRAVRRAEGRNKRRGLPRRWQGGHGALGSRGCSCWKRDRPWRHSHTAEGSLVQGLELGVRQG